MQLEKAKKISAHVIRADNEYWHYYIRTSKKVLKITGKYLFFSEYKEELNKIAIEEIENGGFFHAKISTDEHKKGKDYVLCLYYADDSRKFELAEKYKHNEKIYYRYWKSDEATLKGTYSKEFLSTLTTEERKEWTRDRL